MGKRKPKFTGRCFPQVGRFIRARGQDTRSVRTELSGIDSTLMNQRKEELARAYFPEFGGFVPTACEDTGTIRTKCRMVDDIAVSQSCDQRWKRLLPMDNQFLKESLRSNVVRRVESDRTGEQSHAFSPFSQLELAFSLVEAGPTRLTPLILDLGS